MKKYLEGTYSNQYCSIEVACYPRTPSLQASLRTNSGILIPITKNLGSTMPLYQCVLADGIFGPGNDEFMAYIERNELGYIVDYKRYDRDPVTNRPRRVAALFRFYPERLKFFDPYGCKQYERHEEKLLRKLYCSEPTLKIAC